MIDGKTIHVSGGTEQHAPKRVIVFSRDDPNQHETQMRTRDPQLSF